MIRAYSQKWATHILSTAGVWNLTLRKTNSKLVFRRMREAVTYTALVELILIQSAGTLLTSSVLTSMRFSVREGQQLAGPDKTTRSIDQFRKQ